MKIKKEEVLKAQAVMGASLKLHGTELLVQPTSEFDSIDEMVTSTLTSVAKQLGSLLAQDSEFFVSQLNTVKTQARRPKLRLGQATVN